MSVYIENEINKEPFPDFERVLREVADKALKCEGCPYEAEINIIITDNEAIREMNQSSRGIDKPTDVLSFPMNEFENPGEFGEFEGDINAFNPETGELLLGDIVISHEKAKEQAEEFGHGIKREMAFLTAHSMLHLMGYDHMDDDERRVMEKKQEEILSLLGIDR